MEVGQALVPNKRPHVNRDASRFRILAIMLLCFVANAFDGFDLLSIAFAGPAIVKDWRVAPDVMGLVFGAAPVGMAIGALILGVLGDRWGRREAVVTSLAIMGVGSLGCAFASNVDTLIPMRLITGLGLGGALTNLSTVVAELVSPSRRNRAITFLHVAYSLGTIGGAWLASEIIPRSGWHSLFLIGGVPPLLIAFCLWWLLATPPILDQHPPTPIRHRIVPAPQTWRALFSGTLARPTTLIVTAFFCCWLAIYFLMNWIPIIMVNVGYDYKEALQGITVFNCAALAGTIAIGYITTIWPKVTSIAIMLLVGGVGTILLSAANTAFLVFFALAITGLTTLGALIGLYLIAIWTYPQSLRATGLGFALSVGRLGAILGPVLGGIMISSGVSRVAYFPIFAALLFLSAWSVFLLRGRITFKENTFPLSVTEVRTEALSS
jgi:MFS transporter, AAHS family, 4-hydroxybenzoate transporter